MQWIGILCLISTNRQFFINPLQVVVNAAKIVKKKTDMTL